MRTENVKAMYEGKKVLIQGFNLEDITELLRIMNKRVGKQECLIGAVDEEGTYIECQYNRLTLGWDD